MSSMSGMSPSMNMKRLMNNLTGGAKDGKEVEKPKSKFASIGDLKL